MINDTSLKAKIRNFAERKNISAQAVLQIYLMIHFLNRIALTGYREKFVIKGGMLISSIVGIEHRATMDLDTTLRNLPLTEEAIREAFSEICAVDLEDGIVYSFNDIVPIRSDDEYGGYRVTFSAAFGKINAPMSMDISTGDIITPEAAKHTFIDMFDENMSFDLWAYPIETVLAEKVETILSRGTENTRPRDFYDVYMISAFEYDKEIFKKAYRATALHRESLEKIENYESILSEIGSSKEMKLRWKTYARQMPYAENVSFADTLAAVQRLME